VISEVIEFHFSGYDTDEAPFQATNVKRVGQRECGFPTNPIENRDINTNCFLFDYRKIQDIPFIFDFSSIFFDFEWKKRIASVNLEPYLLPIRTDLFELNIPVKIPSTNKISVLFHINEYKKGAFRAAKE